ncbi:uncharacterized protein LOC143750154 isoform X2 [Siphateles boraxobius]|uniref:uncharacterized protein LOC143750154 isoform X2 n=1 Tax=Siphateles boraxobius TaxID=180520 RepID=UPI004064229D
MDWELGSDDIASSEQIEETRQHPCITETIEKRRAMCEQQDRQFNASLLADREKEMRRQHLQALEERRLKAIDERRQRMVLFPEPSDGVPLRLKFPNGLMKTRKFMMSESIKTLFDFVGQEDSSTEHFSIREATSGIAIHSNALSGSIEDHNIMGFSTLYVLWTPGVEEEVPSELQMAFSISPPRTSAPSPPRTSAPSPPRTSAPSPSHSFSPISSPTHAHLHAQWSPGPSPPGSPDILALDTRLYALIGMMISVCVIHGGVGPHFFSKRLFLQLCGKNTEPAVFEVGDHSFKEKLLKIKEAETVELANNAISEAEDSLSIMGALRTVRSLQERDFLVQSALGFYTNGRTRAALAQ